jgi:hypothetical protein
MTTRKVKYDPVNSRAFFEKLCELKLGDVMTEDTSMLPGQSTIRSQARKLGIKVSFNEVPKLNRTVLVRWW